ncbi:hypothetical protein CCYA_CCYA09G2505 [Cyanidiococcus yangmingshanensis]|nr:hypothetical protein CCYA_CCYA09G2505 [Cyanidiococcus yangmingshanensis]
MMADPRAVKNSWKSAQWPNYLSFPPYSFHRERAVAESGTHRLGALQDGTPARRLWVLPCHWRLGHLIRKPPSPNAEAELVALDLFHSEAQLEHLMRRGVYVGFLGSMDDDTLRCLFPELNRSESDVATGPDSNTPVMHELFVADVTDRMVAQEQGETHSPPVSVSAGIMDAHGLAVRVLQTLLDAASEQDELGFTERIREVAAEIQGLDLFALRSREVTISDAHAALLAQARTLSEWHHRNRFCSSCGHNLVWPAISPSCRIGRSRHCARCDLAVYPRIDPVVIVLVVAQQPGAGPGPEGAMCLLGRKHQWLAGRYSCVAGFVEAGETLEEAVVREVAEEAGIRILPSSIRYASSQTWPFPSQLMVGFYASVSDGKALPTPQPADGELEAVAWFRADQVRTMLSPEAKAPALHLPPRKAIAHRLVADWLASLDNQNKSEVADALGHD